MKNIINETSQIYNDTEFKSNVDDSIQNRRACNFKKKSSNFLTLFTLIVEEKILTKILTKQCKIFKYLQTYTLTKSIKTFSE